MENEKGLDFPENGKWRDYCFGNETLKKNHRNRSKKSKISKYQTKIFIEKFTQQTFIEKKVFLNMKVK